MHCCKKNCSIFELNYMNICSYIDLFEMDQGKTEHKEQFEEAAYTLRALANETRLCVIMQLSDNTEKSVTELMQGMDCEQSLLSHHLTDMRAKGILSCRKSGKNCYYSIRNKRVLQLLDCIMKQC